ncbi:hypothetical protein L6164_021341 [Bauhinia variegata]|uniref:Uncharacterized protein n=1 Tax=Bauhinia variegata TaxID=167791 RepID=A0ACB9MZY8_BAUVA|nr:hypothetical protein L6164_021341 [Bauhinia variegata]
MAVNSLRFALVTIFIFGLALSSTLPCAEARPRLPSPGVVCPQCACCTPTPPGFCCDCMKCAALAKQAQHHPQNNSLP